MNPSLRLPVAGAAAVGIAIAVSSFTIARAEHAQPVKVKTIFNCSSGTACLQGNSNATSTFGLSSLSAGTAVVGSTTGQSGYSGVAGISSATTGQGLGVYGYSANGAGVSGTSTQSGSAGVAGYQLNTSAATGPGVFAQSADNTGSYATITGQGLNATTELLWLINSTNSTGCLINNVADLYCDGTLNGAKAIRTRHIASTGQHVLAYAAETASATLEDVGVHRMVGGIASVAIDRDFGSTIDRSAYHVFLTPRGDASLYIAEQTPVGFVVRETHGGRSTLDFDYRIIARPIDAKSDRLPLAPARRTMGKIAPAFRPAH